MCLSAHCNSSEGFKHQVTWIIWGARVKQWVAVVPHIHNCSLWGSATLSMSIEYHYEVSRISGTSHVNLSCF